MTNSKSAPKPSTQKQSSTSKPNPNYPSKTGNPSGEGRGNTQKK